MSDNKEQAKRIFNDAPIIEEASDSFKEGVFQGIQLGLYAPLTEEKVRDIIPELDFWKRSTTKHFINYEAVTFLGGYRVRERRDDGTCLVDFGWGLEGSMFIGTLLTNQSWLLREHAFEAAQKDFADRVLKCLGFEPEKNEE